jgi:hypothetical protein
MSRIPPVQNQIDPPSTSPVHLPQKVNLPSQRKAAWVIIKMERENIRAQSKIQFVCN